MQNGKRMSLCNTATQMSVFTNCKKTSPKNQSQRKSLKTETKNPKALGQAERRKRKNLFLLKPGDNSAVVPPGPVPNPEVKRCSADGSRTIGPARVGRRRDF